MRDICVGELKVYYLCERKISSILTFEIVNLCGWVLLVFVRIFVNLCVCKCCLHECEFGLKDLIESSSYNGQRGFWLVLSINACRFEGDRTIFLYRVYFLFYFICKEWMHFCANHKFQHLFFKNDYYLRGKITHIF